MKGQSENTEVGQVQSPLLSLEQNDIEPGVSPLSVPNDGYADSEEMKSGEKEKDTIAKDSNSSGSEGLFYHNNSGTQLGAPMKPLNRFS